MSKKLPFLIIRNLLSPLYCEKIINDLNVLKTPPMIGQDGNPKKMLFMNRLNQIRLSNTFGPYVEELENHFDCEYFGTHSIQFEWYPKGSKAETPRSDGYAKNNKGWIRHKEIDMTGILWLNDYNDNEDFDPSFESYGGKLEFPTFDISFTPERGSMIIFPVAPNFIHTVAGVEAGSMSLARFTIRTAKPYEYKPENFDTNPNNWNI